MVEYFYSDMVTETGMETVPKSDLPDEFAKLYQDTLLFLEAVHGTAHMTNVGWSGAFKRARELVPTVLQSLELLDMVESKIMEWKIPEKLKPKTFVVETASVLSLSLIHI